MDEKISMKMCEGSVAVLHIVKFYRCGCLQHPDRSS